MKEIAARRAAGVTPLVTGSIAPYSGPWAATVKEEVARRRPARARRDLTLTPGEKKRAAAAVRRAARAAKNYPYATVKEKKAVEVHARRAVLAVN